MNNAKSYIDNLNAEELEVFKSISEQAKSGNTNLLNELYSIDYEEIPVTIDQFLEDDRYLGLVYNQGKLIYPFWRQTLRKIFHENADNAFEIIFTGCIGSGKTTIATIGMLYLIYRTMCLRDPQKFYGLAANSPIAFACMNLTLELANSGMYTTIVEAMKMSPWFQERVDIRGKYDYSVQLPKNLQLTCASQTQHTIGKNILGSILDELNFSNAPKGSKNSVIDMYNNIRRRLESRFLKQGRIPGFLFMVSSKNNELSFLEQYIDTIRGNKTALIIDKAIYEIKPPETYMGPRFSVAVGDKTKASRILDDSEDAEMLRSMGYKIIHVPIEYRTAFEQDINEALKDIAGESSVTTNKLIPYAGKIESTINHNRRSPFMVDEIILDLNSPDEIKDFLDDIRILKNDIHIPRFLHCDLGLKNDRTGLSMVHSDTQTSVERYTMDGKILSLIEQHYVQDFSIGIKASAGSEVPIYKIRNFILWLATSLGLHIQLVSFDGYQSSDSLQLLKIAGIDTKLVSVDRTVDPYMNLKACILENRLELYNYPLLTRELYDIEYDPRLNKVDHTLTGSKDIADSLCAALWDAQEYYTSQATKVPSVVQHDNVKQAVDFLTKLNQKRWASNNSSTSSDDAWIIGDYKQ